MRLFRWCVPVLLALAASAAFARGDDECDATHKAGRDTPNEADALDHIAVELRAWWDNAKDTLTFDAATGKWSVAK